MDPTKLPDGPARREGSVRVKSPRVTAQYVGMGKLAVWSGDRDCALDAAARMDSGQVDINGVDIVKAIQPVTPSGAAR